MIGSSFFFKNIEILTLAFHFLDPLNIVILTSFIPVRMPKSKRGRRSKSKSGYICVRKKLSGKYEATIWIDGKQKHLGSSYDTAKQAAKTHDKEAIKLRTKKRNIYIQVYV